MNIEVEVKAAEVLKLLGNGKVKMAYAIANALNGTIKAVQVKEQHHVARDFTVRKKEFTKRQSAIIKREDFANAKERRFRARVAVGTKPRHLLAGYEKGEARKPFKGKRSAVPIVGQAARPNFAGLVPEAFTFKGLRLRKAGGKRGRARAGVQFNASKVKGGKVVQYKGAHRTFILKSTSRAPEGGVFQRIGPGRDDIRLIYSFKPSQKLAKRLGFEPLAHKVAVPEMRKRLTKEIFDTFKHKATKLLRQDSV